MSLSCRGYRLARFFRSVSHSQQGECTLPFALAMTGRGTPAPQGCGLHCKKYSTQTLHWWPWGHCKQVRTLLRSADSETEAQEAQGAKLDCLGSPKKAPAELQPQHAARSRHWGVGAGSPRPGRGSTARARLQPAARHRRLPPAGQPPARRRLPPKHVRVAAQELPLLIFTALLFSVNKRVYLIQHYY